MEFDWSVQIGAYSTKDLAQSELEAAVAKGGLTAQAHARLCQRSAMTVQRSIVRRIIAMSESEAASACAGL